MDATQSQYDEARSEMLIAGSRCHTLLKLALNDGVIPANHVSHVREVLDHFERARSLWLASMNLPQEVARA